MAPRMPGPMESATQCEAYNPQGRARVSRWCRGELKPVDDATQLPVNKGWAARVGGFAWELTQTVLLTLLIFFAVRAVVQNFKVEGNSMEPTLHTDQFLIINKATYLRVDGTPLE